MKRTLTLLLAVMMLALLPALPALAEEPIKVTVIGPSAYDANSSEEGHKMIQDWILENTGVLVEGLVLDGTNDTEQRNALLMGDKTIDVWWGDWMVYGGDNDMIQPLNDYLQYIPNMLAAWENYGGLMTVTDNEGTVWGLPRNANRVFYQTFIREDFLKALGYTEETYPTTFEEFEKYLYAVKAADPVGNGETIPLITRNNLTTMEFHFLGGFTPYGRSNWLDEADGLIKPYYLQPGYYDFLVKMNQWYNDGIIHKENYTWNLSTVREHLASGRVAASGAYSTDLCNQYINLRKNVPDAKWWASYYGMTGPNGELCETQIKAEAGAILFNKKSSPETVKAFLKVLEFQYSDWGNNYTSQIGPEGTHWVYDTETYGEEAKTLHIVKNLGNEPAYRKDFWYSIGLPMEADCVMYDADGVQNMQNEYIRHQGDTFSAKAPFDIGITYNTVELYENVMSASDIETMYAEEVMKFFNGDRPLTPEEWQKFIDGLYKTGMQEYCEEFTRQYKKAKGID